MQKVSDPFDFAVKNDSYCREPKSFCFLQQDHINFHPGLPKGSTWHFIETKAIKHYYYSRLIICTHKNSRDKWWVVSQQALFFNAFLVRHDDFNDAHIKD